jgi:hypothetical protein
MQEEIKLQIRFLHLGAVLIVAITFQHGHSSAQTVSPRSVTGTVTDLKVQTSELAVTAEALPDYLGKDVQLRIRQMLQSQALHGSVRVGAAR